MFSKKKESKKAAIAKVALKHRVHLQPHGSSSHSAFSSSSKAGEEKNWGSSPNAGEEMFKQLGENINTRWNEISEKEMREMDEDEVDVFDEKKRSLMEEARMAAGTRQRPVATLIREYLYAVSHDKGHSTPPPSSSSAAVALHAEGGIPLVRIHHNSNSITAVAALGKEVVVMGDKSGKVYTVTLPSSSSSSFSEYEENDVQQAEVEPSNSEKSKMNAPPNNKGVSSSSSPSSLSSSAQRKQLLFPMMASSVMSIAVSDTRDTFATLSARSLFEKTTVDTSCTSYIAAGCADGSISIWELQSRKHKGLLWLHRKPVVSVQFRPYTSILLSVSKDQTLRMWSVPEMMGVDQFFGHEGEILCCDALRRNTCVTVGDDGTMRYWKLDAATQQAYPYIKEPASLEKRGSASAVSPLTPSSSPLKISLESVAMLNESIVIAGGRDGALVLFDTNRRRPVIIQPAIHGYNFVGDGTGLEKVSVVMAQLLGEQKCATAALHSPLRSNENEEVRTGASEIMGENHFFSSSAGGGTTLMRLPPLPNPITAIAAVPYGDVVASGSCDGYVRLWEVQGVGSGATAAGRRRADEEEQKRGTKKDGSTTVGASSSSSSSSSEPQFSLIAAIPISGMINALKFNWTGDVLFIAAAKEPKGGRWVVQQSALNSVYVVPLRPAVGGSFQRLKNGMGEILHIPAELFGLKELEEAGDFSDDEEEEKEDDGLKDVAEEEEEEESHGDEGSTNKRFVKEKGKNHNALNDEEDEEDKEEEYYSFQKENSGSKKKGSGKKKPLLEMSEDGAMVLRTGCGSSSQDETNHKKKRDKKKNAKAMQTLRSELEETLPSPLKKKSKDEKEKRKAKKNKMHGLDDQNGDGKGRGILFKKSDGHVDKIDEKQKAHDQKNKAAIKAKKEAIVSTKKKIKR